MASEIGLERLPTFIQYAYFPGIFYLPTVLSLDSTNNEKNENLGSKSCENLLTTSYSNTHRALEDPR